MSGEYGPYCDDRMVAIGCDDRSCPKPTATVDVLTVTVDSGPPYP